MDGSGSSYDSILYQGRWPFEAVATSFAGVLDRHSSSLWAKWVRIICSFQRNSFWLFNGFPWPGRTITIWTLGWKPPLYIDSDSHSQSGWGRKSAYLHHHTNWSAHYPWYHYHHFRSWEYHLEKIYRWQSKKCWSRGYQVVYATYTWSKCVGISR